MGLLRLATLLVGSLALQLSLVGDGVACRVASHGALVTAQVRTVHAAMPGMAMPSAVGAGSQQTLATHAPSPAPRPCDQPGAPRFCQAPASCITPFAVAITDRTSIGAPAPGAPVLTVLVPSSLVLPPELPPPRA